MLAERLEEPAPNLSGGQQQMLALAMALLSRPKLLIIDELSLGPAPVVVGKLAELVRDVAAGGTTVLLVEQSVKRRARKNGRHRLLHGTGPGAVLPAPPRSC